MVMNGLFDRPYCVNCNSVYFSCRGPYLCLLSYGLFCVKITVKKKILDVMIAKY